MCLHRWAIRRDSHRVRWRRHRRSASASPSRSPSVRSAASSVACSAAFDCPIASTAEHRALARSSSRSPDSAAGRSGPHRAARRVRTAGGSRPPARRPHRASGRRRRFHRVRTAAGRLPARVRAPAVCGRSGPAEPSAIRRARPRYRASGASTSANRSSAARCSSGRINRSWSFWPCSARSSVVKVLKRLGGHAAAAEIRPRRSVTAHRARRDDAAVVVTVRTRGIEDLVDVRRPPRRRVRSW